MRKPRLRSNRAKLALVAAVLLIGIVGYFSFFRLRASDCTSLERYNALTSSCYYDCTTDQDCALKAKAVDDELNGFFTGSQTRLAAGSASQAAPLPPTSNDDSKLLTKSFTGSETDGTVYTVDTQLRLQPTPSHSDQALWDLFKQVAGKADTTKYIQSFEVFNDANNDSAASVWQSQTAGKWHVNVNAAYQDNHKDLIHTMVHEYGHIVSLNDTQVDGAVSGSCPRLQLDEGCARSGSYINDFYNQFWKQYGDNVPSDEGADQDEVADFYHMDPSAFVSEYAATNYGEDWAESWATFVTQAKPSGNKQRDQKVRFFYTYPALLELRNRIRVQLADNL